MEDCLFCMIAEGKIPSKKLYEDEQVVAFYDINPQAKVHFLVIPKKHITSAAALTGRGCRPDREASALPCSGRRKAARLMPIMKGRI